MTVFTSPGMPQALIHSLERMKFSIPTPIQAAAIPPALEGKDILGTAQTGTGKTAAFGIPLVTKLLNNPRGTALVILPTRELAVQVLDTLQQLLGPRSPINTALLIGGESMPKQLQQIRMRPRLIVGTPGRINDHLERGSLMLHDAGFLVLDETDRMLDLGFAVQIDRILKYLPRQRQTLLFSATLPPNIISLSEKYLTNPVRVSIGSTVATADNLKQEIIHTTDTEKFDELVKQIEQRQGSIIIFVKTKWGTEKLARKLSRLKHSADAIHGDLRQNQRDRVIAAFRNREHRIMVATDIAARGLDIPHIEHVINYDLPQCPEDYIHRIGRTARAGAEGSAICLITPADAIKWRAIRQLMNPGEKIAREHHPRSGGSSGAPSGKGGPRRNRNRNRNRRGRSFRSGGGGDRTQAQAASA